MLNKGIYEWKKNKHEKQVVQISSLFDVKLDKLEATILQ